MSVTDFADTQRLLPAFADPVRQSQQAFRAVMNAIARPGTTAELPHPQGVPEGWNAALTALALTLFDQDTRVWLDYAARTGVPVFAICRGLQFLNHYQGGATTDVQDHVATRHQVSGELAPEGREVNSYHGQGIMEDGLGRDLEVLATGPDGGIEALRHKNLPWLGVMWHPEREATPNPDDLALMRQHLNQAATPEPPLSKNGSAT